MAAAFPEQTAAAEKAEKVEKVEKVEILKKSPGEGVLYLDPVFLIFF